jgi:DNA repair protein RecO (recombination protein O)
VLVKTQGVVIKSVKFQETSLIVKIYTHSHGLLSFLVNGVRSSKAHNKAALFQPLTFLDLVMYYRDNKNLLRLKEFKHAFIYHSLPFDIVKSSVAQFMLEVVEQCIVEEESNEQMYEFLLETFKSIDDSEKTDSNIIVKFLADFTHYAGIQPHGFASEKTPYFNIREGVFSAHETHHEFSVNAQNSAQLSQIFRQENPLLSKVKRKELTDILLLYYRTHIGGFRELRSLKIFETILG